MASTDKLSVLAMILHARTHTAPHRLVNLGINPVMLRSGRCEIDIPPVFGMLGGKDVVEQRPFVIVGVHGILIDGKEVFRQFEHVVRIAGFRTFPFGGVFHTVGGRQEMLADTVASQRQRPFVHHVLPEIERSRMVGRGRGIELSHSFKPNHLGDLRVGMFTIQINGGIQPHVVVQHLMRKTLGGRQIRGIARHLIRIGVYLIHTPVFFIQHELHLGIRQR